MDWEDNKESCYILLSILFTILLLIGAVPDVLGVSIGLAVAGIYTCRNATPIIHRLLTRHRKKRRLCENSTKLFALAEILQMFLPHKLRSEIFEPCVEELKEDFLNAPSGGWKRSIVRTAFYFRLFVTYFHCFYVWSLGSIFPVLGKLLGLGKGKSDG